MRSKSRLVALPLLRRSGLGFVSREFPAVIAVATFFLFCSVATIARDRPGIPRALSVKQESASAVTLSLRNTAREERITFEYEMWINGVRVDPSIETKVSQDSGGYLGKGTMYSIRVSREDHGVPLGPDREFCFRAWSRTSFEERTSYDRSHIRSERPSGSACLVLKPDKPLPPGTVRAYFPNPSIRDRRVFVAWDMPPFEFNRPVDHFTIEREEWSGGRYVLVRQADEPRIETNPVISSFVEQVPPPPTEGDFLFRVCAHNSAGKECAVSATSLVHKSPKLQGQAEVRPELATAGPRAPSTRLFTAAETRPQTTTRATSTTTASTAETETMLCRGGPLMGWTHIPESAGAPTQLSLIFQPTPKAATPNGDGLKPSECAIVGRGGYIPPNVRFEGGEEIKERMASTEQYWSFKVRERSGYFEAVTNAAVNGPAAAISPSQQIQGEATTPKPRLVPR